MRLLPLPLLPAHLRLHQPRNRHLLLQRQLLRRLPARQALPLPGPREPQQPPPLVPTPPLPRR